MSHTISLATAVKMTSQFRLDRENILKQNEQGKNLLPICETFDRSAFDAILSQAGCNSVRIYYGMKDDKKIHAIIVGVNSDGKDILPDLGQISEGEDGVIVEESNRCPPICPPASPLNP